MKKPEFVSNCLNGELRVGDLVMNTPLDDYPIMVGRVIKILPSGSEEALSETENEGDVIHVQFAVHDLPDSRVAEIEAAFSALYKCPKKLEELALDDVIETQDVLLRIDISDDDELADLISRVNRSELVAATVAFETLANYNLKRR